MTQENIIRKQKLKHSFDLFISKSKYEKLEHKGFLNEILNQSIEECLSRIDFEGIMPNEKELHDFIFIRWKENFKAKENNIIKEKQFSE